ncbi:MAG: glycosyltransferase family 2 protein [Lactobacillales bacterium]|jgi:glycosyltransferase involved in cell wall biosynthesis|nr:glycosyltransferase family 2 protein [Lactobacillales bacterium]
MNNKLIVCIDSVTRNGKNPREFSVVGWTLDSQLGEIPTIDVEKEENISSMTLEMETRSDVNALHHLNAEKKVGFRMTISTNSHSGTATLVFSSGEEAVREVILFNGKLPITPGTENPLQKKIGRLKKGLVFVSRNGVKATFQRLKRGQKNSVSNYAKWIAQNETQDFTSLKKEAEAFSYRPKISILMPTYNVEDKWLTKCIDSIENQIYTNWELCIADDASTDKNVRPLLEKYKKQDERIKVVFREQNGHISKATNSALEIATGEFVALLDNDDELPATALFEVVKTLNENPELDLIYSDEDKIDMKGVRSDPTFKPNWSPDLLLGTNYISHLGVYRRSIMQEIGGFRAGLEGSQDYDLVLRFTEKTSANRIAHIPKILYHWRMLPTSTAGNQDSKGYAFEAGLRALQDALVRRGIKGTATHAAGNGLYDVHYDILEEDLVSIIIPTKNGYEDTKRCIDSIIAKTTYANYEIILADNGSTDPKMNELYRAYQKELGKRFIVEVIDIPFNYSRINNLAVKKASGKYLLFLNNDTEVITPTWMSEMVSFAQFDRIGMVGAKLYYPNNTIQHAGVILGLGGVAGHGHHTFPRGSFGYFGRLEINVDYYAVTAACVMVKKADFDQVNGFDENLTVSYNDVDLSIRVHDLGRDNVWLHGVELYHYESQSRGYDVSPEKKARLEKESAYIEERYGDLIENDPYYSPNLSRTSGDYSLRV